MVWAAVERLIVPMIPVLPKVRWKSYPTSSMFILLPSILALVITASDQQSVTASDLAAISRLKDCGLLVAYPGSHRRGPDRWEVAVATNATTRNLGQIVGNLERALVESSQGPNQDQILKNIVGYGKWRYRFDDLRHLTVSRRHELTVMEVDVDNLLTSQSEFARRFLILTARAHGPFRDVPKDHWASQAVDDLRLAGIFVGYPDLTFHGESPK